MCCTGLCSADGDILRENGVVAHWPAAQNTLETAGAGDTRSPLAELSVCTHVCYSVCVFTWVCGYGVHT